jgi:hypothetical protein
LLSCGISYALSIYGGLCKARFRPATSVSRRFDQEKEDYKTKGIEAQIEALEVSLSSVWGLTSWRLKSEGMAEDMEWNRRGTGYLSGEGMTRYAKLQ